MDRDLKIMDEVNCRGKEATDLYKNKWQLSLHNVQPYTYTEFSVDIAQYSMLVGYLYQKC